MSNQSTSPVTSEAAYRAQPFKTVTQLAVKPAEQARGCGLNQRELLNHIPGLTYRQLDFWTRTKRLTPHYHVRGQIVDKGGSGSIACWPPHQVWLAQTVFRLVTRNIQVDMAFAIATNHAVLADLLSELTKIEAEQVGP